MELMVRVTGVMGEVLPVMKERESPSSHTCNTMPSLKMEGRVRTAVDGRRRRERRESVDKYLKWDMVELVGMGVQVVRCYGVIICVC